MLSIGLASWAGDAPPQGGSSPPDGVSSYDLAQQAAFNRPAFYPVDQRLDPELFRSNGDWIGRLILPEARPGTAGVETASGGADDDWVWIQLEQTPASFRRLQGQTLRLTWRDTPRLRALVEAVRTDIHLGAAADRAEVAGNVVPRRLDGRRRVGPLQSLAGSRPNDDLQVRLEQVEVVAGTPPTLTIGRPPLQITGRWVALVRIVKQSGPNGESLLVRHFNRRSGRFDGPEQTVRLPQQPRDRNGRWLSTPRGLAGSPAGSDGWYLYGAQDANGLFTVQALEPRQLIRPGADQQVPGLNAGLRYLREGNWLHTPERRGSLGRILLQGSSDAMGVAATTGGATATGTAETIGPAWTLGRRALVLHLFGGIGGPGGEARGSTTITGHFALGEASVVEDPFTGQPRLAIRYHQIYANNPNGIVAGTQDWSAYMGNLQRGWLGSRPVSDVLIPEDTFSELRIGGTRLSLLDELGLQAEVLMARYRSGDGTGLSSVTPATSCVQDSSQALYAALRRLRTQVQADPALLAWLKAHPDDPSSRVFRQQQELADDLDRLLTPLGMARSDWQGNAERVEVAISRAGLTGAEATSFRRGQSVTDILLSWRSLLPRGAHDAMASVFLRHGSPLLLLRTNQVAGGDPSLEPLAPTLLLGRIPPLATLLSRIASALLTPLTPTGVTLTAVLLVGYCAVALACGRRNGFLPRHWRWPKPLPGLVSSLALLPMPAIGEELLFRVALLPQPDSGASLATGLAWGALSTGLFVLYHPLAAALWYPAARRVFSDGRFLSQCLGLAVVCLVAYAATGSLWPPVLIHWLAVSLWLGPLEGRLRFDTRPVEAAEAAPAPVRSR
ncbi:CPBP family intramembrane metalloprotease [Synechococcus sp. CBW1002]|uniref:CPBP family glutamic-type intramembrane protease n=1 Tax=Synechococcus sp. CBW1002 TaxID=1353134 RepID=UPI0018CC7EA2|nr:CPBP family glutamic-type intramembrane protease [Synechococcus sp. CBW1002]QPN59332.1 CPBP family intramembrane metalloprotease [Synechococcus sp. CBW1002]